VLTNCSGRTPIGDGRRQNPLFHGTLDEPGCMVSANRFGCVDHNATNAIFILNPDFSHTNLHQAVPAHLILVSTERTDVVTLHVSADVVAGLVDQW